MKNTKYIFCFCIFFLSQFIRANGPGDNSCGVKNTTTQNGEEITYAVFYSLAGAYVYAGAATFSNKLETYNGKVVYHVVGAGGTNPKYDWMYKVRDRYESYVDTATMQPLKFIRDVHEGRTVKYENVSFNRSANTAITDSGVYKVPNCIQDIQSAIYYVRNFDFNKYKPGDKIPFQVFLDNHTYDLYMRYLGKEEIKTRYGKFKAVKFKAMLLPGTVFKEGENMTIWVSDDPNRVPLRIESPIIVGSIKVDMMDYKNLRYPLTSLEKKKSK